MRRTLGVALALIAVAVTSAESVTVQTWSRGTADGFAEGSLEGTAIGADGAVRLGPPLKTLWGPDTGVVWQVLPGGWDGLYVARSDPAQVIRLTRDGDAEVVFQGDEGQLVTALAALPKGDVAFGVSPGGRVLRVTHSGEVDTLVETGSEYVWALATDGAGDLWIGVGAPGAVLRRTGSGQVATVHETGDDPVRSLVGLSGGGAVAGTGSRGLVLRLSAAGEVFAAFDADEKEIVAVAAADDGTVYALGAATPRPTKPTKPPATPVPDQRERSSSPGQGDSSTSVRVTLAGSSGSQPKASKSAGQPAAPAPSGGALYRIAPDGEVERLWSVRNGLPWALLLEKGGGALVATGDAGRLVRVDDRGRSAVLLRIPSSRATALARGDDGRIWVGAGSDARVASIGPGLEREGSFVADPVDAGWVADWGALVWDGERPEGTGLTLRVRSGNTAEPDATWTDWVELPAAEPRSSVTTTLPVSRWSQVGVDMVAGASERSPIVRSLRLSYRSQNRPPKIDSLTVEPPGLAWRRGPTQQGSRYGMLVAEDPVARNTRRAAGPSRQGRGPIRKSYEPGVRTFNWKATDPDGDRITYSLDLRREGESAWFPIADEVPEPFYSWDARGLPDGIYRVRLTAADDRDNAVGHQRSDFLVSDPFRLDATPPTVAVADEERSGATLVLRIEAGDAGGEIAALEYRIDGGGWRLLAPEDGVADSERESYTLEIPAGGADRPHVMLRVSDRSGNLTTLMVTPGG